MSSQIRYPRARLSPAKDELVVVEFARRWVESGDISEILKTLAPMAATRENAELFEGRVTFYFSGWDDGPREEAEIPEIRAWFNKLTGDFPYWFHFVEKERDTLLFVLRLLCKGHVEHLTDRLVGWRFDDLKELSDKVLTLFGYMNQLHIKLLLPKEMNLRISEEVGQLIEVALA